jgi:hypothetical protein
VKNITYVAFAALLTMAPSVNARLVTVGNIQTNNSTNFMTTLVNEMKTRQDALSLYNNDNLFYI